MVKIIKKSEIKSSLFKFKTIGFKTIGSDPTEFTASYIGENINGDDFLVNWIDEYGNYSYRTYKKEEIEIILERGSWKVTAILDGVSTENNGKVTILKEETIESNLFKFKANGGNIEYTACKIDDGEKFLIFWVADNGVYFNTKYNKDFLLNQIKEGAYIITEVLDGVSYDS